MVRAIVVEDNSLMSEVFFSMTKNIDDLSVEGIFTNAEDVIEFTKSHQYEIAFLDIELPGINGVECAKKLREKMPKLLIVFITAHDNYIRESNQMGGDDYLVKPYSEAAIQATMEKMRFLVKRQKKNVYVEMFGRFVIKKDNIPIPLRGKTKEILALILVKRGKEISNEEIYSIIWENREYSNENMKVYYNALKRLKDNLKKYNIENIIISTTRGQMANMDMFDCDYYLWLEHRNDNQEQFEGEFLTEYTWGEYILPQIYEEYY